MPSGNFVASEQITSMVYSPPHLITAHANNTMKQYTVDINDFTLDISFKQTLYGHTFKVDALAVDASRRKLVSGDRSGIKIWDLSKQGECQVTLSNHVDQSNMTELPPFDIKTIGFDEDKIIAIVNLAQESFIRLWSFNSIE
jgi:WD40 repeat protein